MKTVYLTLALFLTSFYSLIGIIVFVEWFSAKTEGTHFCLCGNASDYLLLSSIISALFFTAFTILYQHYKKKKAFKN